MAAAAMTDLPRYHLRELPVCRRCSKAATCELRNSFNAVIGVYCKRCGAIKLREMNQE